MRARCPLDSPPPPHFNTGHYRAQLIEPRYPSRCYLCSQGGLRRAYLAHGLVFCVRCTLRQTQRVDEAIVWARRQRSREE
jgi:hypothetical protein